MSVSSRDPFDERVTSWLRMVEMHARSGAKEDRMALKALANGVPESKTEAILEIIKEIQSVVKSPFSDLSRLAALAKEALPRWAPSSPVLHPKDPSPPTHQGDLKNP